MHISVRRALGALLLMLVIAAAWSTSAAAQGNDTDPDNDMMSRLMSALGRNTDQERAFTRLTVRGTSDLKVPPDQATVSLTVETRAETAAEALAENAENADAVIDALLEAGLTRDDIETRGFNVYPVDAVDQPRPDLESESENNIEIAGFVAMNTVEAKVVDLDRVGEIIEIAIDAGATGVANLQFGLQNSQQYRHEALAAAVRAAAADGEAVAATLGGQVVRIAEVSSGDAGVVQSEVRQAMDMAASAAPPIEPGEISVTAYVELILEVAGASLDNIEDLPAMDGATIAAPEAADAEEAQPAMPATPREPADAANTDEPEDTVAPEDAVEPEDTADPYDTPEGDDDEDADRGESDTDEGDDEDTGASDATPVSPADARQGPGDRSGMGLGLGDGLPFVALAQGETARYRGRAPRVVIAASTAGWSRRLQTLLPDDLEVDTDWDESFLVGVFLGERARGGASVSVERLWLMDETLVATIRVVEADASAPVALSSPYQLIRVDRSAVDGDPEALAARYEELAGR